MSCWVFMCFYLFVPHFVSSRFNSRWVDRVAGNASNSQESVLLQGTQKTQMLAFKEFEPERNVMAEFDAE